ncbi:DUF1501 domain-containing protein [Thalassoglobus polymorphus]|uniref:DUF1501 domain-containing protein n=1 Tax=Thalassoglobus polymorphus TaxID=2527994 RepID=A0A517QMW2_9PLAN|nr:DUF1501 domain-containing protein [Thalassoglobus polymorphus]QDT32924.1 hypothetical protein Mal48_21720 [Thalassoglobus polymorphus]
MNSGLPRREFLRTGLNGFAALSLPSLLQLQAQAKPQAAERTAVILVWLRGGASHLETFDPKPNAPSDYRGPFSPISTNIPGIQIGELLPRLAQRAHQYTLVRSLSHTGGGHPAGSLQMLSGDPDAADKRTPKYPDWMSIANSIRSDQAREIPNYIAVNPVDRYDSFTIAGPTYLGPGFGPFQITGDPSHPEFQVPNIGLSSHAQRETLQSRVSLRRGLDRLQDGLDQSGLMQSLGQFETQAMELLLSSKAREAFDLSREPQEIRERYGMHRWGQQCLMARRLVEAGVDIITTEFDGPLCGRVANWDDHAVNHHVFDALQFRAPYFDQAVSALIEDVYARGLSKRVLVVVTGEFGRTPRISHVASSGAGVASSPAGTVQPGRDHWPRAGSMLFAGGGITTGNVIGATDAKGEDPISERVGPEDFLATIYHHLGIDIDQTIEDFSGRPTPIIRSGKPIPGLT